MPTNPPLGFDSNEYTSEGEFYRSNSPEQLRLDEKRNYAFGGGLLKGITELPLELLEFMSPADEYVPGALAPDQSSPRQRLRTERLHGEQFYDELKADPDTAQAAEVGYGTSFVVDPIIDTGIGLAPHLIKGFKAISKGERAAPKLANLMSDEVGAITAYHGTPHEVDKFSMDRVDTGQGAQTYGHGLYFAENKEVADTYRDLQGITEQRYYLNGERMPKRSLKTSVAEDIEMNGEVKAGIHARQNGPNFVDAFNELKGKTITTKQDKVFEQGPLYEVDLDVDPEDLLDWDKPLSEQPEIIKRFDPEMAEYIGVTDTETVRALRENAGYDPTFTGKEFYEYLSRKSDPFGGSQAAEFSDILNKRGIKGIRYFDQASREAGKGSRNIVMFDDSLINIKAKNNEPIPVDLSKQSLSEVFSEARAGKK